MKIYDDTLPFLNRTLYSFSDSLELWHQYEKDIPRIILVINNQEISTQNHDSHILIHDFLFGQLDNNILLIKYALASCTQAIFAQPFSFLQNKLHFYVIGECVNPEHMKIYINSFENYLEFTIAKKLCSYKCKNDNIVPTSEYDIRVNYKICKNIIDMSSQKVCITMNRL